MRVLAETRENGSRSTSVFSNFTTSLFINEKLHHFEISTTCKYLLYSPHFEKLDASRLIGCACYPTMMRTYSLFAFLF